MQSTPIRIGTRASRLAQVQARQVQAAIVHASGGDPADADVIAPLVLISTAGDRIQDRRLLEVGGKALFTKEIEQALLVGRVDLAVHSLKDVPAEETPGLAIAAYPEREDPRDAFVSLNHDRFEDLALGARLGTASLRRQAQALHRRPDLQVVMLRGNVETRLRKLEVADADATLLACAGLRRLGLADRIRQSFDPVAAPPAPGQGVIAIQTREADVEAPWATALHHAPTALTVAAERGALEALEGSCRTAMGAYAWLDGDVLRLVVEALTPDGRERWRREGALAAAVAGDAVVQTQARARALGLQLGLEIKAEGGDRLILDA